MEDLNILTLKEVCGLLRISSNALRVIRNKNLNFPAHYTIGKKKIWLKNEIIEWVKQSKTYKLKG